MKRILTLTVFSLLIISCGQINKPSPSTDGGNGSTGGGTGGNTSFSDRGVIKDGSGTTVARVVDWDWGSNEQVIVFIPAANRYAKIQLSTGNYLSGPSTASLYYADSNCTGSPIGTWTPFIGEVNKTILFWGETASYFLIGSRTTINFNSSYSSTGGCQNFSGSSDGYSLTATARPYDFTQLPLPLTITYE